MANYRPRRANLSRWLESAPEWVLDVFDEPSEPDRYTVLLTGSMLSENPRDAVYYIASTLYGTTYFGELSARETAAYRYRSARYRVRWLDLPEGVRSAIANRVN